MGVESTEITKKRGKGKRAKIPISTLIEYSRRGMTYREIGKLVGCDHTNVLRRFQKCGYSPDSAKHYRNNRIAILENLEHKLISSMTEDDLSKASLMQKASVYGIVYDKRRLEEGKPTTISQVGDITKQSEEIEAEYKVLSEKLNLEPILPSDITEVGEDS